MLLVSAILLLAPSAQAAAVADASFETPALALGGYQYRSSAAGVQFFGGSGI